MVPGFFVPLGYESVVALHLPAHIWPINIIQMVSPLPVAASVPSAQSSPADLRQLVFWRTFPFRLALCLALAFALIISCVGWFTYRTVEHGEMEGLRRRLNGLVVALSTSLEGEAVAAAIAEEGTASVAYQSLYRRLRSLADAEADIESIYVMMPADEPGKLRFLVDASKLSRVAARGELYDASNVPLLLQGFHRVTVEQAPVGDEFGQSQSAYAPLRDGTGRVIGVIGVDVLAVNIDSIRAHVATLCLGLFGAALLVMVFLCIWVGHQIRRPLSQVMHAASAIADGHLDTPIPAGRSDEFGVLLSSFSQMVGNLRDRERLRETFGLYISRELADSLLREGRVPALGGTECVATILFLDVQDFTRISETLSPSETIAMLNDYLSAMVEVIKVHRGCALDFVGDGVITVFGAPFYQPEHATDAVRCALAMDQRMAELNSEWTERGLSARWQKAGVESVHIRMGLHTGSLVAGNIGSSTRMKYSVIGDTVNIAARLEAMNKEFGTSILMSDEVRVRLPLQLSSAFVDRGTVPLRGRQQGVRAFSTS